MPQLFEYIDSLSSPYEAFWVDSHNINDPNHPHWHYYMELIYIISGDLTAQCEEKRATLHPGDFILFHPKTIHTVYPVNPNNYRYGVLKFDVSRLNNTNSFTPRLRTLFECARRSKNAKVFFSKESVVSLPLEMYFETCINELEEKAYGYDIIVHSLVCQLLTGVLRIWREDGFNTIEAIPSTVDTNAIESITEYIDEHSQEQILVEDLAARCNMSYSYFAKNFKQIYGRSCKEYIEFVRVCKAEELLLFTDYDLSYISQETGFSDCSHLIKIFKRWKGITPKQYKLKRSRMN